MLKGSVRYNLDPTITIPENEVIKALQKVGLWSTLSTRGGLDAGMDQVTLSHGQRQLFALARAMLKKSRVLVLDEATSSIDRGTDQLIQRLIREEFEGCTILAVAHRLDSIADFDKVAILDDGEVFEMGRPSELLADPSSAFRRLYMQTGA